MTSIYDVPYEDIQKFLLANNENIRNQNDAYDVALELLKDKKVKGHTTSIIEWMMAHNLLINNLDIPIYSTYEIDNMSQIEINKLAKLLTMKGNNLNNIKNILRYLNKLNDDKEFLLPDINDVILNTLTQLEFQNIKFDLISFNDLIGLLENHRNKNAIRKLISENLEKIIIYHSFGIYPNNPDIVYVLDNIFENRNIHNKNIMIEIIKDNKEIFLKDYTDEEINDIITQINELDEADEAYQYEVYIDNISMAQLIDFTFDLIAADEIGLAKQTFNIINKFKLSIRSGSYNYELVKRIILSEYTDVLKNVINFFGEEEFVKMFDEFIRNETTDSQYIKNLSFNLIRLKKYNLLIDILKTLIDHLRYNYRGGEAMNIENVLRKIQKAIKSKNDDFIMMYIKDIQTILNSDDSDGSDTDD